MSPSTKTKRPRTPGVTWKPDRQRLYRFTQHHITVIQPWPAALCWVKTEHWRGAHCSLRLDLLEQGSAAPYPYRFELDAWSTIPKDVRTHVLQASLSGLQWNTLRLLARCPAATALVQELPLLGAAAANLRPILRWQERPIPTKPWRSLRRALAAPRSRHRWARIARLVGWPGTRSFFKMLRKVGPLDPEQWVLLDVARLGEVWSIPWLRKILQHGPALTPGRLAALVASVELAAHGGRLPARLFLHVSDHHTGNNLAGAIRSFVHAAAPHAPHTGPAFTHLDSLEAIEQATARLTATEPAHRPFPPPPLGPVPGIIPIASPEALVEEGEKMHHCIGSGGFARRARAWQGYAYSVRDLDSQERLATAWIVPSHQSPGAFYIEQIQGPNNTPVPFAVRHRVERWLLHSTQARGLRLEGKHTEADLLAPPVHSDWLPAESIDVAEWLAGLRRYAYADRTILHPPPMPEPAPRMRIMADDDIPF